MHILPYADYIVTTVTNLLLNDPENANKAFATTLRVTINDYSTEEEIDEVGGFLGIAVLPTGYRQVYASFGERPSGYLDRDWQLVCRHDSAWRDDGVRSTLKEGFKTLVDAAQQRFKKDISQLSVYISPEDMALKHPQSIFNAARTNSELGRLVINVAP
jgi:hypothetical protein